MYAPDTLYLDEATNQLDAASAHALLTMLRRELPDCTVIGVTHQQALMPLFERTCELQAKAAVSTRDDAHA